MIKYLFFIAALAVGILSFTSCSKEEELPNYEEMLKEGLTYLSENAEREGIVVTESGLQYEVLREGKEDGKTPKIYDKVRCHYTGTFINGRVFDSSYESGNPIVFSVSGVISGWTEGLQYMKEGAKYKFYIPYYLGYGPMGYASIPPYSTLIFEVELLEVL